MSSVASRIYSSTRALRQHRQLSTPLKSEQDWRAWTRFLDELTLASGAVLVSVETTDARHPGTALAVGRPLTAIAYNPREDLLSLTVTLRSGLGELRHLWRAPKLLRAKRLGRDLDLLVEDADGTRTSIGLFNIPAPVLEALPAERTVDAQHERESDSRDAGSRR